MRASRVSISIPTKARRTYASMTMPLSSTMSSTSARLLGLGARFADCMAVMRHPFPFWGKTKLNSDRALLLLTHGRSGSSLLIAHLSDREHFAARNQAVLSGHRQGRPIRPAGSPVARAAREVCPELRGRSGQDHGRHPPDQD